MRDNNNELDTITETLIDAQSIYRVLCSLRLARQWMSVARALDKAENKAAGL